MSKYRQIPKKWGGRVLHPRPSPLSPLSRPLYVLQFWKIFQSWLQWTCFFVKLLSFLVGARDWSDDRGATYGKELFNYSIFAGFPFQEKKTTKLAFLKVSRNSYEKICAGVSILIKLQAWALQLYLKRGSCLGLFMWILSNL